jgi:hypothetical protein
MDNVSLCMFLKAEFDSTKQLVDMSKKLITPMSNTFLEWLIEAFNGFQSSKY